jgi:SAM-dependent methyltransferase
LTAIPQTAILPIVADVETHYKNLLADVYTWMTGGAEARIADNREFFSKNNITPFSCKNALDLGCGSGFQSIPLADRGYAVTAFDFSGELLDELESRKIGLNITTVKCNLLDFAIHAPQKIELAVCMGDTLPHLSSPDEIERLLLGLHSRLEEKGRLLMTFRNLTKELPLGERFIPVRSDDSTIFACHLEYEDGYVIVNDILYTKGPDGWALKKSYYKKLRIKPSWVEETLGKIGYHKIDVSEERGIVTVIAEK